MTTTNEVMSDQEAFDKILGRLNADVGTILQLIPGAKQKGLWRDTAPFWALARLLFPVAESVGDLIYRDKSTVANLKSVLEKDFEAVRHGYQGKAAILAILFRHSLTHTDELRMLHHGARKVKWSISWDERPEHLRLTTDPDGAFRLKFDTTAFFDDLVAVLTAARKKAWGGKAMSRYNSWRVLKLDKRERGHPAVIKEIDGL